MVRRLLAAREVPRAAGAVGGAEDAEKKAAAAAAKKAKTHRVAAPAQPPLPESTRTKGLWLLVPLGLISLIILGPLAVMIVIWLRNKREARRFMRSA